MGGEKPRAPTPGQTLGGRGLLGIAAMALYCMNRSGGESLKMTERGGVLNPSPATAADRTGAHLAPTQNTKQPGRVLNPPLFFLRCVPDAENNPKMHGIISSSAPEDIRELADQLPQPLAKNMPITRESYVGYSVVSQRAAEGIVSKATPFSTSANAMGIISGKISAAKDIELKDKLDGKPAITAAKQASFDHADLVARTQIASVLDPGFLVELDSATAAEAAVDEVASKLSSGIVLRARLIAHIASEHAPRTADLVAAFKTLTTVDCTAWMDLDTWIGHTARCTLALAQGGKTVDHSVALVELQLVMPTDVIEQSHLDAIATKIDADAITTVSAFWTEVRTMRNKWRKRHAARARLAQAAALQLAAVEEAHAAAVEMAKAKPPPTGALPQGRKCHVCGSLEHIKRDCPKREADKKTPDKGTTKKYPCRRHKRGVCPHTAETCPYDHGNVTADGKAAPAAQPATTIDVSSLSTAQQELVRAMVTRHGTSADVAAIFVESVVHEPDVPVGVAVATVKSVAFEADAAAADAIVFGAAATEPTAIMADILDSGASKIFTAHAGDFPAGHHGVARIKAVLADGRKQEIVCPYGPVTVQYDAGEITAPVAILSPPEWARRRIWSLATLEDLGYEVTREPTSGQRHLSRDATAQRSACRIPIDRTNGTCDLPEPRPAQPTKAVVAMADELGAMLVQPEVTDRGSAEAVQREQRSERTPGLSMTDELTATLSDGDMHAAIGTNTTTVPGSATGTSEAMEPGMGNVDDDVIVMHGDPIGVIFECTKRLEAAGRSTDASEVLTAALDATAAQASDDDLIRLACASVAWGDCTVSSLVDIGIVDMSPVRTLTEWHHVFSHLPKRSLLRLLHANGYHIIDKTEEIDCHACVQAKTPRRNKPPPRTEAEIRERQAQGPGIVQLDLHSLPALYDDKEVRKAPHYKGGFKYMMLTVDTATTHEEGFMMKRATATDIIKQVRRYEASMVYRIPGYKLRRVHVDAGSNVMSAEVIDELAESLTIVTGAAPFCHNAVGMAERGMRTHAQRAISAILGSGLDRRFLPYALPSVMPTRGAEPLPLIGGATPYFSQFSKPSPIADQYPFGAEVFALQNPATVLKGNPRNRPGRYIGRCTTSGGHLVYIQQTNQVVTTKHCVVTGNHLHDLVRTHLDLATDRDTVSAAVPTPQVPTKVVDRTISKDVIDVDELLGTGLGSDTAPGHVSESEHGCDWCDYEGSADDVHDHELHCDRRPRTERANVVVKSAPRRSPRLQSLAAAALRVTLLAIAAGNHSDPQTWREAMHCDARAVWEQKDADEIEQMRILGTWEAVPASSMPPGTMMIPIMKVPQTKRDPADLSVVVKRRVRHCGLGYRQLPFHHYRPGEISAPVAAARSLRTVTALAAHYGLQLETYDATSAHQTTRFPADHPRMFMARAAGCPTHMPNGEPAVIELKCAIQGLRQASALWSDFYDDTLRSANMVPTVSDSCIYRHEGDELDSTGAPLQMFAVKIADDLLMASGDSAARTTLIEHLCSTHGSKEIEPATSFAGINIIREPNGGYSIHQTPYVREMLERFKFTDANPRSTPLPTGVSYQPWEGPTVGHEYSEKWGAIAWLACTTYSMLAGPVMIMGRYLQNPGPQHFEAVNHILRWLVANGDTALTYGVYDHHHGQSGDVDGPITDVRDGQLRMMAYADAEFGSLDQATRRSAGGYCVKLAGALIDWGCRFHRITSQSTAESEYYTLSDCVNALLHLRQLFAELEQGDGAPTLVYEDNGSVIAWAKTRKIHRAAKHIQIRYHAVKQYVLPNGTEVDLQPIPSAVQVADYFTKSLAKHVLERHLRVAGHTKIQG